MNITVTKTQKVEQDIDIELPSFYKNGSHRYYAVISESNYLDVLILSNNTYAAITADQGAMKARIAEIYSTSEPITKAEFGEALIQASDIIAKSIPDSDPLRQIIFNAQVEYTGPSTEETLMGHI